MQLRARLVVAGLAAGWLAISSACMQTQFGGQAMTWPQAARLGDTVAMGIDSNYIPVESLFPEKHDLSRDNVTLQIRRGSTVVHTLSGDDIVAVFDGHAAPAAIQQQAKPGVFLTIVVFNLPAALDVPPASYPSSHKVRAVINGVPDPGLEASLNILGTGGSPTDFYYETEPVDLEPRPTLRLRPNPDATWAAGFEADQEIGGIEFMLEYPTDKVSDPEVFGATEAHRGLAFLGPNDPMAGQVRVFFTDPRGFTLPDDTEISAVGEGVLLEFAFIKLPGESFDPEDFTIRDLKVTDPDGVLLTPVYASGTDTTDYFERIVRKNLAE